MNENRKHKETEKTGEPDEEKNEFHSEPLNIQKLFEDAKQNPETKGQINIDEILKRHTEKEGDTGWTEGRTVKSVQREIFDEIDALENIDDTQKKRICENLIGYRFIGKVNDFRCGKITRSINIETGKFTFCGILMGIQFTDNGIIIKSGIPKRFFMNIKFDENLMFQKMTDDEQIILLLQEKICETT